MIAILLALALQASDAERLKALEDTVKKQQQELDALKKAPEAGGAKVSANPADGFRVTTADGNLDVHVGGRFQEHYRAVFDRPDSARTTPDTFFIRAARLKVDGTFFKEFAFQVEGDFPSSSTGPAPTLQASYVEWKRFKELRVQAGQFKVPFSQERLRSRLFSDFVEDSMLTRFTPGYDIGLQVLGSLADGALGYQIAVENGRSHLDNQGRSRSDDNDEKELAGRLTLSPWASDKDAYFLKGLRLGGHGTVADIDDVAITGAATVTTFDLITPELNVTLIDPATAAGTVNLDGRRTRFGADLSWAVGPVCLRGEFMVRKDEMVNGAAREDVTTKAWSGTLSWIVTGEDKNPETRIVPTGSFGAIELAARVAGAEVGDEIADVGVTLTGNALEVTSYTFGVNWWLTRNVRVSANVIREDYGDPIDFGSGRIEDSLTGFLARFQIDF